MTVRELIEALYMYDADMKVYVRGFDECGLDDADKPKLIQVRRNDDAPRGHCGRHEEIEIGGDCEKGLLINFD